MESGKRLPLEIISWLVQSDDNFQAEDSDGEERSDLRMITILDTHRSVITYSVKSPEKLNIKEHIKQALRGAMEQPFCWKPRRPSNISFQNCPPLSGEDLNSLGLELELPDKTCCQRTTSSMSVLKSCTLCRRRGEEFLFQKCPQCCAVFYCSTECCLKDSSHPSDAHGHTTWCTKMESYREANAELGQHPFTFIQETSSADFDLRRYESFLRRYGIFGRGLWYRELPEHCYRHSPMYGTLMEKDNLYVLEDESRILSQRPQPLSGQIVNWEEYYQWRGLSLDSPVAILLSTPLTIYHIISHLFTIHYPNRMDPCDKSALSIHVIGVEKEADYASTLQELCYLAPERKYNITMIGPDICREADGNKMTRENLEITLRKGLYHQLDIPDPDVVIGFNAGLAAYTSWMETLQKLQVNRIPAFFTDYCRYSCECSKAAVKSFNLATLSDITINPFRSPVRKYCEEHDMPWYSNGFIFSMKYQDEK